MREGELMTIENLRIYEINLGITSSVEDATEILISTRGLPKDAQFRGMRQRGRLHRMKFAHPSFSNVPEGAQIPIRRA